MGLTRLLADEYYICEMVPKSLDTMLLDCAAHGILRQTQPDLIELTDTVLYIIG